MDAAYIEQAHFALVETIISDLVTAYTPIIHKRPELALAVANTLLLKLTMLDANTRLNTPHWRYLWDTYLKPFYLAIPAGI